MIGVLSDPAYFLTPLIVATVTLFLLIIAAIWSRRDFSSVLFCGILASLVLWNLFVFSVRSSPDIRHALAWARAEIVPAVAVFVLYYHFTLIHTNTRRQRRILLASYLFLAITVALAPTDLIFKAVTIEDYGYNLIMGQASYFLLPVTPLLILGGARNLLRYYKVSPSYEEKNRLIYLVVAAAFPLIGALLDGFTNLPPALIWGNLIFSILCTIAIVKYHLLDIRIVFRKSLVYLLVSVVVAIPYVGILVLISEAFRPELRAWWIYALMILLLAIILRPLYGWAQNLVDRLFYRDRYSYLRALEHFSRETRSIVNSDEMASTLVKLVSGALRSSNTCLLLPSDDNSGLAVVACVGLDNPPSGTVLRNESLLVKWLKLHRDILPHEDFNVIPQLQSLSLREKNNLEQMRANLYVPIKTGERELSGLLVLGQKLSQQSYSSEDKQLLITLSSQMAMALENARLYSNALRARENLETWLNGMSDCVMIVDTNYTMQFMNKAAIDTFGSTAGEKCWNALRKDTACLGCPVQYYHRGSRHGLRYSVGVGNREYDIAIAPLLNPDGTLSVIEVLRDVTESKKMEERERRLKEELLLSSRLASIGELAAGVAHEINNPLTVIIGLSQRLLRKITDEKVRHDLETIHSETWRAARVVENLLAFGRQREPKREYLDINEVVQKALELRAYELKTSNIGVILDLAPSLPQIMADFHQMQEVFLNIILNAEQAMTEVNEVNKKGKLRITTEEIKEYIRIALADDGPGIPDEYLHKLFDPFFTMRGNRGGTGLGLSICHGIVTEHGGKIYVRSKLRKGTTFFVELPIMSETADKNKVA